VTDGQPPGGEHDDPLLRAVAEYWDDIQRLADSQQLERLAGLLAGTAEADPGVARAALADALLDILPPGHPAARVLRSSAMYSSVRKIGTVVVKLDHDAGSIIFSTVDADTMPVTIYLTDEHHHAQVESAVETLLATAHLRIVDRDDPVIGSWFRRMTARAKDSMQSPASQDAALAAAHALNSRLILAQDAEVTAKLLENLAPVIVALEPIRGAVIRAGALLVVKQEGDISVLQLSAAQQARLDHHPQLVRSPHEIVAAVSLFPEDRPCAGTDDAAVLDLYVEEPILGQDSRFLRETGVSFGQPRVAPVPDDELPSLGQQRRLDLPRMRVIEVVLPFDLEEPPDGCRYTEATVRMTFDSPDVRALSLSRPSTEGTGRDRGDDSLLDTRGVGRQQLAWKLSARDEQLGLRPNGREVQAVVGTPIASKRLTGTLDVSIRFTRQVFGVVRRSTAEPRHPLRFALDVTDGTFETLLGGDSQPRQ
jgi:hypothetical protein